ncbi:MAG: IPT/TIG domain-containing protein [Actinomycetota bacterium]
MLGAGGALVVGYQLAPGLDWLTPEAAALTGGGSLGVYVTIGADESVTLTFPGAEMGQGTSTALLMIIAEELMIDWTKVRFVLGGYDPALNRPTSATTLGASQSTGGSSAVRMYHDYLRNVGATARQKLIWAANALDPSIPIADLKAVDGTVVRISTGAVVGTYGALAATATSMNPNDVAWVKPPYRFIGQPIPRLDIPSKVDGSAVYGIDVRQPNMLYASVQQAPKVGQTVGTVGTPPAGTTVVPVPGGVAVVTDTTTWQAVKAARSLAVTWVDAPYTAKCDSTLMAARAKDLMATGTAATASPTVGDANATIAAAPDAQKYGATYSAPYVPHVTMEPMNATALVTDTTCEIWAPTQVQTKTAQTAATITGLPLSAIKVNTTFLGGGMGRRLEVDFIKQAVTVAMANKGRPVKLVWSREEDFTHDVYRPASLTQLDAAVDTAGKVTALKARVVCPSSKYQAGTLAAGAVDGSAVDGLVNAIYNFPNKRVEWVLDTIEVPVGSWRSVGNSQNCFFLESFLDEIAAGTKQDPITLRRNLLNGGTDIHKRALAVLDRLAVESGWSTAAPSGTARGVALSMSFGNTIVGEVAEVSGSMASGFRVGKVTVVIDPGSVINPDTVKAQVESAVNQGIATTLWGQMTFAAGEPMLKNFHSFRMMRLRDAPVINTVILQSGAPLGGVGEPGLPPIAPAIGNAIARLTGTRVRTLPVSTQLTLPQITGFTPTSGPAGTVVTINGLNFTGTTAVKFNGLSATTFTVVSATQISATVPSGASTGPVTVITPAGSTKSTSDFTIGTVVAAPTVSGLSPTSGSPGTVVTVTGTNFTGITAVKFNGLAAASFAVTSTTKLTAVVPAGATTGKVAVTNSAGTASSSGSFTVTSQAPAVTGFSPTSGPVGTTVTITGSNFAGATGVKFNGVSATFSVSSATQIVATVPTGATTGKISVTTPSGTASSASSYTVSATTSTTAGSGTALPTISKYTPSSGPVGTKVTLTGTNFTGTTSVRIGTVAMAFTVVSATQITATVPSGSTTGRLSVTNASGTATTAGTFSVG